MGGTGSGRTPQRHKKTLQQIRAERAAKELEEKLARAALAAAIREGAERRKEWEARKKA